MAKAMLKLENIVKDYKVADTVVHALKGVSLSFRKNEFVSILGHSGCGKTTLLNIIGGLDHYTSGDLIIRGKSTKNYTDKDWDSYRNHSIGFVFQSYNLIPHQTVLGNVELALTLSGISAAERKERARQALVRVGLTDHLDKKPNQLSGGQMQRVAIARALVNDPEILLADEPTGALDTETSVQIMDLIKEIAGERLVIMVTHNPELAEKYSTRIVRLTDGEISDDSDPFEEDETEDSASESLQTEAEKDSENKKRREKKQKTSMSFLTAFGLSGRNLLTKRARTLVTSIAGSIGIIGVCLVLALSSGFNGYIRRTEEDMLSAYPIEITETTMDYETIMNNMMNGVTGVKLDRMDDKVYVNSFLSKLAEGMTVSNDITQEYLDYVATLDPEYYGAIQYSYGININQNLYTEAMINPGMLTPDQGDDKEQPVNWSISTIYNWYTLLLNSDAAAEYSSLSYLLSSLGQTFGKIPGTTDLKAENYGSYVLSQYEPVAGRFPQQENEIILVIDSDNEVTDLVLAQLGLLSQEQFLDLFTEAGDGESKKEDISIEFEDILNKKYTLYYNDAIYHETGTQPTNPLDLLSAHYNANNGYRLNYVYDYSLADLEADENEGVELEIVGIYRPKGDMNYGCLSTGLNCTEALINSWMKNSVESKIVNWMQQEGKGIETGADSTQYYVPAIMNVIKYLALASSGSEIINNPPLQVYENITAWESAIRSYGGNDMANAVYIYALDFETKDMILAHLDRWNDAQEALGPEGNVIQYSDKIGLMMTIVQTILDAITYVLIAFTGISLVVSSVMIGVITYVSVVERTKEIGVLRSIGARKRDIKHVFNAETFIIGLCAGLIGVIVSYLLCLVVNLILTPLTGISSLASLPLYQAGIMILVSVALTLISGLIPASAAAKKDPVIALRTE